MRLVWLLHIATRWLLTLCEAGLLIWACALAIALAGWLAWCGAWMVRRAGIPLRLPPALRVRSRGRVAFQARAER